MSQFSGQIRKLMPDEVATMLSQPLRESYYDADGTSDAADYVIRLQREHLEGRRIYWGGVTCYQSADRQFDHLCVSTIEEDEMPYLVIVRDRNRDELIGHYFAPVTEFPLESGV